MNLKISKSCFIWWVFPRTESGGTNALPRRPSLASEGDLTYFLMRPCSCVRLSVAWCPNGQRCSSSWPLTTLSLFMTFIWLISSFDLFCFFYSYPVLTSDCVEQDCRELNLSDSHNLLIADFLFCWELSFFFLCIPDSCTFAGNLCPLS